MSISPTESKERLPILLTLMSNVEQGLQTFEKINFISYSLEDVVDQLSTNNDQILITEKKTLPDLFL